MNYIKIYADFLKDRRSKEAALIESDVYKETHHIKPRSMGGKNTKANLIRLTAADHYFAHLCLAKIHGGRMWVALRFMGFGNSTSAKHYIIPRHFYELAILKYSQQFSDEWNEPVMREKRVAAVTTKEVKAAQSETSKRMWKDTEYRNNHVQMLKNKFADPHWKANWMEANKKSRKRPEVKAKRSAMMKARYEDPAELLKLSEQVKEGFIKARIEKICLYCKKNSWH